MFHLACEITFSCAVFNFPSNDFDRSFGAAALGPVLGRTRLQLFCKLKGGGGGSSGCCMNLHLSNSVSSSYFSSVSAKAVFQMGELCMGGGNRCISQTHYELLLASSNTE